MTTQTHPLEREEKVLNKFTISNIRKRYFSSAQVGTVIHKLVGTVIHKLVGTVIHKLVGTVIHKLVGTVIHKLVSARDHLEIVKRWQIDFGSPCLRR